MTYYQPLWRAVSFLCSASLAVALAQSHTPAPPSLPLLPQDATLYVKDTIQHQLEIDAADNSHWRYRIHREDDKGSQDRDVIDTREGQIARTLLINGEPLTTEQRATDEARMKKLVEDPSERAKRDKRAKDDRDRLTKMVKAIPEAFIFKYDGEESGQVRLTFTPNPRYVAPTRELQIFHSLSGRMWIDRAGRRLARMDGSLFEDVTFGWGLLGKLNKGGSFSVAQNRVVDDHWELVSLDIKMSGRAVIFKTINVKQMQRMSDFRRVRDDLTIPEAYQLLEKGEHPVSADNQPGAGKPRGKD